MTYAIAYRWTGEAMKPVPYFADEAKRAFKIGEMYRLSEINERSTNTHNHYFACLTEAWRNLPEEIADRFPKVDHLRAYALIRTGYCNSASLVAGSPEEAKQIAAFMRPLDEFSVIDVKDCVVTRYTAKSQSYQAMDKQEFKASKDHVLEFVATLANTTPAELAINARVAA